MALSVEELLKTRFKVIGDYPDSQFKVGEILYIPNHKAFPTWFQTNRRSNNEGRFEAVLEKYPNIFKKLFWWEERQPEDMPEYVRQIRSQKIIKSEYDFPKLLSGPFVENYTTSPHSYIFYFVPATKEEYDNQIKKN